MPKLWIRQGLREFCSGAVVMLGLATAVAQEPALAAPQPQAGKAAATATALPTTAIPQEPVLRMSAGDLIEVRVFGVDELRREARISSSGDISLPLAGALHIAGLSSEEGEKLIAQRLKDGGFLINPQVSILVKEFASQGASVMGEVNKPGIYPVLGVRRLFDIISAAGGTTSKAGRLITITRRDRPDEPIRVTLADDPARSIESNVEIYPGDTILVAKAGIVYVVGDVSKPGGFVMENNEKLTVLQAIALAQGANRTASLGKAKLIRRTPEGIKEIPIPLDKILAAKAADQTLQADDIVFVPNSAARSAGKRGLEAIVQTVTGVLIYSTVR